MESNKARVFFRGSAVFVFPSLIMAGLYDQGPTTITQSIWKCHSQNYHCESLSPSNIGFVSLSWTLNKQINQSQKSFILQESKMTKPHSIFQIIILLMVQNSCTRLRLVVYPHDLRCGFSTIQPQWVGSRCFLFQT